MNPSMLQLPVAVPPEANVDTSQRSCGGLPCRSTRRSFPCCQNPTKRLSGDQNGKTAPSVPGNRVDSRLSSDRTHSADEFALEVAENTNLRPSGERAGKLCWNDPPSGGSTANRIGSRCGGFSRKCVR